MSENKLHLRIALLFELQKKGVALNLDQEFLIAAVLENQDDKFAEISKKAYALGDGFTFKMLTYTWDYLRNSLGKGYETAFSIKVSIITENANLFKMKILVSSSTIEI